MQMGMLAPLRVAQAERAARRDAAGPAPVGAHRAGDKYAYNDGERIDVLRRGLSDPEYTPSIRTFMMQP